MANFIYVLLAFVFTVTPLIFSYRSSELFEFPKILTLYLGAALLAPFVLAQLYHVLHSTKKSLSGKLNQYLSPFQKQKFIFLALGLFLVSQLLSTLFSIDRHTSIFGYYSRFNGGLLSLLAYLTFFLAIYFFFSKAKVHSLLRLAFSAGVIVLLWGLPSHFGRDPICAFVSGQFNTSCWTADFIPEKRIFATIGQPNWLATFILLQISLLFYFFFNKLRKIKDKIQPTYFIGLLLIFFLATVELYWTDSRSGFLAYLILVPILLAANWFFIYRQGLLKDNTQVRLLTLTQLAIVGLFAIIVVAAKFSFLKEIPLWKKSAASTAIVETTKTIAAPENQINVTPSSQIRYIVWKGAVALGLRYPLFGSGVETFAYSYYFTRPVEHNLTSEWNYIYNKAHNEILNYFATTGFLGILTYLLMYVSFLLPGLSVCWKQFFAKEKPSAELFFFASSYLFALLAVLITNFFGFATTVTSLYFFTLPAMLLILVKDEDAPAFNVKPMSLQNLVGYVVFALFMVVYLSNYLMADYYFALGKGYRQINELQLAYENTQKAISLRREPNYLSQQAMLGANLAAIFTIQQNPIEAKRLSEEALSLGSEAISISPQNVTYLKDQAKTYYLLSLANLPERGNYFQKAVEALEKAAILAPTDPIIPYTLGALFSDIDAPRANRLLQSALKLRPNYTEANDLLQKLLAK